MVDSTIFNCWAINHGEYNLSGLIIYDSILKKIKYEEGYFIYQSQYLNSQVVDSLIFLNLKAYKQDYSSLVWGNTVQIPFDSILRSEFAESNSLLIRDNKLTKVLRKEKRKKFIMNKYAQPNNIIPSNYKITGDKLFYLFKLNIEYQTSDRYFADRMIVTSNGRIKQIKIPYYYITRINSLEQFIPSK